MLSKRHIVTFSVMYLAAAMLIASLIYVFSRSIDLKTKTEILQHVGIGTAAVVGGLWASYRFFLQRGYETALQIDFAITHFGYKNGRYLVFADAILTNRGQTRISARPKRYLGNEAQPLYRDAEEVLYHSCSLQLRCINQYIESNTVLDWFESEHLEDVSGIPKEVNLLYEYDYSKNGAIDFWIEPNEIYHCSIPLILACGDYVAKVSFIGNRGGWEFWSRVFVFRLGESDVGRNEVLTSG